MHLLLEQRPSVLAPLFVLQWHDLGWPMPDLIAPTPGDWFSQDHWKARQEIALALSKLLAVDYFSGLRIRRCECAEPYQSLEEQSHIGLEARPVSVRHAARIVNKTILLIHDIYRSGQALEASARALREHGALDVFGLSVAQTIIPSSSL